MTGRQPVAGSSRMRLRTSRPPIFGSFRSSSISAGSSSISRPAYWPVAEQVVQRLFAVPDYGKLIADIGFLERDQGQLGIVRIVLDEKYLTVHHLSASPKVK